MKSKPRISKEKSINEIIKLLKQGYSREQILVKNGKKWQFYQSTFDKHLKIARELYKEQAEKQRKKINEVEQQEMIKAHKNGLKTRIERLMDLQGEIAGIDKALERGVTSDTLISGGSPKAFERKLTQMERERLIGRKQSIIKQIQDMEADALPAKSEVQINTAEWKPTQIIFGTKNKK